MDCPKREGDAPDVRRRWEIHWNPNQVAIMDYLKKFRSLGFPITWTLLSTGWNGPGKFGRLIDVDDISEYATQIIERPDGSYPPEVVNLAAASAGDPELVETCLKRLSATETVSPEIEARKWRYVLLEKCLGALPKNEPIEGLVELTTFWEQFDYPPDSPLQVQGRNNQAAPTEYYTVANYESTIQRHLDWMENERRSLETIGG